MAVGLLSRMRGNIGDEIKLWRKRVGLTQEEVAARLTTEDDPVSRERYAKWERGEAMPPLEHRLRLSELGLAGIPGVPASMQVAETRAPYFTRTTPTQLLILIETIYATDRDPDLRAQARRELYRLLELEERTAESPN